MMVLVYFEKQLPPPDAPRVCWNSPPWGMGPPPTLMVQTNESPGYEHS